MTGCLLLLQANASAKAGLCSAESFAQAAVNATAHSAKAAASAVGAAAATGQSSAFQN